MGKRDTKAEWTAIAKCMEVEIAPQQRSAMESAKQTWFYSGKTHQNQLKHTKNFLPTQTSRHVSNSFIH